MSVYFSTLLDAADIKIEDAICAALNKLISELCRVVNFGEIATELRDHFGNKS